MVRLLSERWLVAKVVKTFDSHPSELTLLTSFATPSFRMFLNSNFRQLRSPERGNRYETPRSGERSYKIDCLEFVDIHIQSELHEDSRR